jgi:hypothetical protein
MGSKPQTGYNTNAITHDTILGIDYCNKNNISIKYSNEKKKYPKTHYQQQRTNIRSGSVSLNRDRSEHDRLEEVKQKYRNSKHSLKKQTDYYHSKPTTLPLTLLTTPHYETNL